jgi:hydroxymethylpyrimidine pyrophosphatase-like HAD family hydrolase
MKYAALATDYDGTLAFEGAVADSTVTAIGRARAAGVRLLLVTGRELTDLFNTFDDHTLFDFIVAENGAVIHDSAAGLTETIAAAPPPALLAALARQRVPVSTGRSIVATSEPHEEALRTAIRDLGLDWHVVLNKGSVMALPSGVGKASGLAAALVRLSVQPEQTIGVGDAENDEALLRACGLAVAVANALPSVKHVADIVTANAYGAGVAEVIDRLLANTI